MGITFRKDYRLSNETGPIYVGKYDNDEERLVKFFGEELREDIEKAKNAKKLPQLKKTKEAESMSIFEYKGE